MEGNANCSARRCDVITGPHRVGVSSLPHLDRHFEMTRRVGYVGKKSKILGGQGRIRLSFDEQIVRSVPIPLGRGATRPLDQSFGGSLPDHLLIVCRVCGHVQWSRPLAYRQVCVVHLIRGADLP